MKKNSGTLLSSLLNDKSKKKITKKNQQHTTPPETLPTNTEWWQTFSDEAFMFFPEKQDWRGRLKYSLFKFFEDENHVLLEEFFQAHKMTRAMFDEWCDRYEDLAMAKRDVKIFIATHRRKGAIQNKLNYQAAYRDMHMYDNEWGKNVDDYHANVKAKSEGGLLSGIRVVEIDRYPDSPLVPKKKENA